MIVKKYDPIMQVTWYIDDQIPDNMVYITDEDMLIFYYEELEKLKERGVKLPK